MSSGVDIKQLLEDARTAAVEDERSKQAVRERAQQGADRESAAQSERPGRIAGWTEYAERLKRSQSEWIDGGSL